jgi:hypothetical protein
LTLCIAAICTHREKPAIVLCHDWRSETGDVAGGDVLDKLGWVVPERWAALKAGPISEADRLVHVVATAFQEAQKTFSLPSLFDIAMERYKWMLVDHYLQARLGITYASLIGGITLPNGNGNGKVHLPEKFVDEKLHEVENVPFPNCQLIVAGFTDIPENRPVLCVLNEDHEEAYSRIRFETNFAAIGSGAPAALTSLYRREHTAPDIQLMKAVYHIFEAKVTGEISPGVGDSTSITVLFPEGEIWDLSAKGHKRVNDLYDYFGPKLRLRSKRPDLKAPFFGFKDEYFEPYELPWSKLTLKVRKDASGAPSSNEPEPPSSQ